MSLTLTLKQQTALCQATATTEPTIEATDGTMPVATATTEPTIEATDGTMPVATATI